MLLLISNPPQMFRRPVIIAYATAAVKVQRSWPAAPCYIAGAATDVETIFKTSPFAEMGRGSKKSKEGKKGKNSEHSARRCK
jgi:hypothetical protein